MGEQSSVRNRLWLVLVLSTVVLVVTARSFLVDHKLWHPDEYIPAVIVPEMQFRSWDTNWDLYPLPEVFKYPQYNFASYLYFSAAVRKLTASSDEWWPRDELNRLRRSNIVLLTGVLLVSAWLARQWFGPWASLLWTVLLAWDPLLLVDAAFARPETWMTLLTLGTIAFAVWPAVRPVRQRYTLLLAASFLVGLATACKFTMALVMWTPLFVLIWNRHDLRRQKLFLGLGGLVGAAAFGFIAGVPYAIPHWREYLNGVLFLKNQYASLHVPHAHLGGERVWDLMVGYGIGVYGYVYCFSAVVGATYALWRYRLLALATVPVVLVFFVLFGSRTSFYERNLSPVQPLIALYCCLGILFCARLVREKCAAAGVRRGLLAGIIAAALLPSISTSSVIVFRGILGEEEKEKERFLDSVRAANPEYDEIHARVVMAQHAYDTAMMLATRTEPAIVVLPDYADPFSEKHSSELVAMLRGAIVQIGAYEGWFHDFPRSTLQVYFGSSCRVYRFTPEGSAGDSVTTSSPVNAD